MSIMVSLVLREDEVVKIGVGAILANRWSCALQSESEYLTSYRLISPCNTLRCVSSGLESTAGHSVGFDSERGNVNVATRRPLHERRRFVHAVTTSFRRRTCHSSDE